MSHRPAMIAAAALLLLAGGALAQEAGAPPAPAAPVVVEQPAEPVSAMTCADCHDEKVKAFTYNVHARGSVEDGILNTFVCETCHEGGFEHMEAGGDVEKISIPRGRAGADTTCVMCHETATFRGSHRAGPHANSAAVNCLSCHSVHSSPAQTRHLLVNEEQELCASCHSTQVASMRSKPFAHRMGRGGVTCTSCHDAHGRSGKSNLKTTAAGETACVSCHTEKRGPFVFQHGAMTAGDCTSCHEAHGSSNSRQLKRASVAQLCLECHTLTTVAAASIGSQPPSFHNVSNARYQNCTTCHVTVHGSNRSPALLK